MRQVKVAITRFLRDLFGLGNPGKPQDMAGIAFIAQRTRVDAATEFAEVLGPGPHKLPEGAEVTFVAYKVGDLSLPSGRVVAADGFVMLNAEPFTRCVPPGSYPVSVAVAVIDTDQRIAFAQIRFSKRRVARWEMALRDGQDPSKLKEGEAFAYGVDSGSGCFADPGAIEVMCGDTGEAIADRAIDEMKKVYEDTRDWTLINTPKGSAAVFSSGLGDGVYPSYFGVDENGEPVVLVTDFYIIDWNR